MEGEQPGAFALLAVLVLCIAAWWWAWRRTSVTAKLRGAGRLIQLIACFAVACLAFFGMFCLSGGILFPDANGAGHIVATLGAIVLGTLVLVLWRMSAPSADKPTTALVSAVPVSEPVAVPVVSADDFGAPSLPREFLFSYTDAEGQSSRRRARVMGIASNDGRQYLDGFCLDRNAVRTFRVDRIQGDLTDAETGELVNVYRLLAGTDKRRHMDYVPPQKTGVDGSEFGEEFDSEEAPTTVLFTGFAKARKQELEAAALAAGWVVRSTVSDSLDYLVAGPKAGPTKLVKAQELFITVLDEDEFYALAA